MGRSKNNLNVKSNEELASYIVNEINKLPEITQELPLPVQGEGIQPIGKLILKNERYKNAFLNICNVIGLTVISRNTWNNPWEDFTVRGQLSYGQTVRELAVDIAPVFDYNTYASNPTNFLNNVVPNVYEYLHELNYQKFYKTTTSDEQIAMAFTEPDGLFNLIDEIVKSLYEGYQYDRYIVDKYQLCRRLVDGTITPTYIENYASLTPRQRVSKMKAVSNNFTFMSPNYNPAGLRRSTRFDNQILIMNNDYEAELTTEVLSTSFFINEAEFKTRGALSDGFGNHDVARLVELLGNQYIPFTSDELVQLSNIPAVLIDEEFFQDYYYAFDNSAPTESTEFRNPETLKTNHWLHVWMVISSSIYRQATVFTKDEPKVTSISVSPSTATLSQGAELQMKAIVTNSGFANKAVVWSIPTTTGVSIDPVTGLLKATSSASTGNVTVTATSVYDSSVTGTATITIGSSTTPSVESVEVSATGGATSIEKGSSLQLSATVTVEGGASQVVMWSSDEESIIVSSTGLVVVPSDTTAESVTITATSVFDNTKSDDITLTITEPAENDNQE